MIKNAQAKAPRDIDWHTVITYLHRLIAISMNDWLTDWLSTAAVVAYSCDLCLCLHSAAIRKALHRPSTLQHRRQRLFLKYSSSGDCLLKLVRQWLVIAHIFLQSICINITIDQVPSSSSHSAVHESSLAQIFLVVSFFVDSSITSLHETNPQFDWRGGWWRWWSIASMDHHSYSQSTRQWTIRRNILLSIFSSHTHFNSTGAGPGKLNTRETDTSDVYPRKHYNLPPCLCLCGTSINNKGVEQSRKVEKPRHRIEP